jgi:hypothetical protein
MTAYEAYHESKMESIEGTGEAKEIKPGIKPGNRGRGTGTVGEGNGSGRRLIATFVFLKILLHQGGLGGRTLFRCETSSEKNVRGCLYEHG